MIILGPPGESRHAPYFQVRNLHCSCRVPFDMQGNMFTGSWNSSEDSLESHHWVPTPGGEKLRMPGHARGFLGQREWRGHKVEAGDHVPGE